MFSTIYGLSYGMFVCHVTRLCVAPKEKNAVVRGGRVMDAAGGDGVMDGH